MTFVRICFLLNMLGKCKVCILLYVLCMVLYMPLTGYEIAFDSRKKTLSLHFVLLPNPLKKPLEDVNMRKSVGLTQCGHKSAY